MAEIPEKIKSHKDWPGADRLVLKVKLTKQYAIRVWLGAQLVALAAVVIGCDRGEVEIENDEKCDRSPALELALAESVRLGISHLDDINAEQALAIDALKKNFRNLDVHLRARLKGAQ